MMSKIPISHHPQRKKQTKSKSWDPMNYKIATWAISQVAQKVPPTISLVAKKWAKHFLWWLRNGRGQFVRWSEKGRGTFFTADRKHLPVKNYSQVVWTFITVIKFSLFFYNIKQEKIKE